MKISLKQLIAFMVSLAMFMEALDATIINTAIPSMALSLTISPLDLKLALVSYLLSLAIFIPISGWLADKWGIKQLFIGALSLFVLSSIACGFSHTLIQLVLARIIQGLGGAMMLPVGRLILLRTFARAEFIGVMNHVVMVGALGVMLGPVLGGFISDHYSWHWIFWINIPVGILALSLIGIFLPAEARQTVYPLDTVGFLLFGSGLCALIFGLSALSETMIAMWQALILLALALLLLTGYFVHSRKKIHPIVNVRLFSYRSFQTSIAANLIARLGFGGMPFLLPLLLQLTLGYSAQLAGFLLAPIAFGMMLSKLFAIRLLQRFGYKKTLMVNTLLVSLLLCAYTRIDQASSITFIATLTLLFGLVVSLQYSGMNSLAYADILPAQLSAATSVMAMVQQLAQSLGVAVSALLVHYFSASLVITTAAFHATFGVLAMLTLLATAIFLRLTPEDGRQMLKTS